MAEKAQAENVQQSKKRTPKSKEMHTLPLALTKSLFSRFCKTPVDRESWAEIEKL